MLHQSTRACSIPNCTDPAYCREMCQVHYTRWLRHGDPLAGSTFRAKSRSRVVDPAIRFWSHVDKNGPIPANKPELGPCWLWTGKEARNGYGHFWLAGHTVGAHRFGFELQSGEKVPPELEPDHLCFVKLCVRRTHMEIVTPLVNKLRSGSFFAKNAAKTHCKNGHPFDEENTYAIKGGGRLCKRCGKDRYLAKRAQIATLL